MDMARKTRGLWLLMAATISLMLCIIFVVSSIVFASSSDEPLARYPGCDSYQISYWFYRDTSDRFYPEFHSMSQRERTALHGACIQITLFRATVNPAFGPTVAPEDPLDPRS